MVNLRLQAKALERQSGEKKLEADNLFIGLKDLLNVDVVETDLGTYRWVKKAGGNTFDQGKCKDFLLKKGVNSDLVAEAFMQSQKKKKDSEYAGFFSPGEKGDH
jgi:hypothetical protein